MRAVVCDVCQDYYSDDAPMIGVVLPPEIIGEEGETPIALDICSFECLRASASASVEEAQEPPKASFKPVTKAQQMHEVTPSFQQQTLPTFAQGADAETIDKLSEQATGVKRKY